MQLNPVLIFEAIRSRKPVLDSGLYSYKWIKGTMFLDSDGKLLASFTPTKPVQMSDRVTDLTHCIRPWNLSPYEQKAVIEFRTIISLISIDRINSIRAIPVWSEGYRATGQSSGAMLHGYGIGETFEEACDFLAACDPDFRGNFNRKQGTFWGCRLYNNQADAMRTFG